MAVVPVVLDTQLRCKICASPARDEVNALIGQWKVREVSKDELLERMAALGIDNPNLDNIKGHTGTAAKPKHVRFVDEGEAAADAEATDAMRQAVFNGLQERIANGEKLSPDDVLDTIVRLGMTDLELRAAEGKPLGVTIDHILKAIDSKTRRKTNETQQELLGALTGGIGMVFQKALGTTPAELPAGQPQVVEAEVVREEDAA